MPIKRFTAILVLVCLSLLGSFGTQSAQPALAQGSVPRFEAGKCQFRLSGGTVKGKWNCGNVIVPADHNKPDGDTIKLAVAVFKAIDSQPEADPVIYLEGGPGGFTLVSASFYAPAYAALRQKRDLILFDQRGTGYSQPSLYCPELTDLYNSLLDQEISPQESAQKDQEAALTCRQRLVDSGVDVTLYNSVQNGADVVDILKALGYKQANLYGISYGTRLALTIMRDHPEVVRSAVIDSVVPLGADRWADQPLNTQRAFDALFKGCAADAACNKAYPNLEKVFYQVVDQLNKKPQLVNVATQSNAVGRDVMVDGNGFVGALFQAFYITSEIPRLPALIYDAKQGTLDEVADLILSSVDEQKTISLGLYWSTNCREKATVTTPDQVQANLDKIPKQLQGFESASDLEGFSLCKAWAAGNTSEDLGTPFKSDIPTLVIEDTFDPVTPPAYGKSVADLLSHSYYYEITNAGHGASLSGACPFGLVRQFIDNPTTKPEDACVAKIGPPKWVLPGQ